ncbi:myosin-binding protein 3-like isoform X2 [Actinidia eriantha]|uniref:myosin-binding protein 3-like isoform X2 n=1 Tax=Actinidia eriantha TaxID=165200 RepID=UPI00258591FD|nr:myosin-binding protein 3-like isoform X2 [Actinidia eriantha]
MLHSATPKYLLFITFLKHISLSLSLSLSLSTKMAANKFATMLQRNTHKITVILVYAVLEWVLILLLLLNSLFSFLISKFATYFGLKPPCLWCSRVDHILDPNKGSKNSYRDLVCESHAAEISKLGYCPNHQKLAETHNLCKDCLSTKPKYIEKSIEISRRIAFFTWVSENRGENCEKNSKCSCCDESLSSNKVYPSLLLFKPSWGALGCKLKGDLTSEVEDDDNKEDEFSDTTKSDCFGDHNDYNIKREEEFDDDNDDDEEEEFVNQSSGGTTIIQICHREDESLNIMNLRPQISTFSDVDQLVPISVIDSSTIESQITHARKKEGLLGKDEHSNESSDSEPQIDEQMKLVKEASTKEPGEEDDEDEDEETKSEIPIIDQGPKQIQKATSQKSTISAAEDCEGTNRCVTEKREFGTEESWDGSVIGEMEGGDGALTIEKLKSALRAERKALSSLYAELEEERNAAAIATNQTMAMITRLQEEKAAMQMEALQYQRMMEEQSEYDQEALQLLNELMMKREKEKQELEKELEVYRKTVFDYAAKEKMTMMRRKDGGSVRSKISSASGIAEDINELSIDLNSFHEHQEKSDNNTSIDSVHNLEEMGIDSVNHLSTLDDSLAEFDEERFSILEELKALEERLFTLADDEEQLFEDVEPIEYFADYGIDDDNCGSISPKENGVSSGISGNSNGEHCPEINIMHSKAKNILPLFDATGNVNEEEELNEEQIESDPSRIQNSSVSKFEVANKKLAIEEDVDHVYERLQALETDREFLKHCIGSLKKGEKGMDLLQEILQHLRDLRTVELRARNVCDNPLF